MAQQDGPSIIPLPRASPMDDYPLYANRSQCSSSSPDHASRQLVDLGSGFSPPSINDENISNTDAYLPPRKLQEFVSSPVEEDTGLGSGYPADSLTKAVPAGAPSSIQ
mmetsp:Transcript_13734/g.13523  ORF Transcript_13734/g.13523 Transcript_13734/m.13523 type:complete len:108 (-) Transcript_13734:5-328(-)